MHNTHGSSCIRETHDRGWAQNMWWISVYLCALCSCFICSIESLGSDDSKCLVIICEFLFHLLYWVLGFWWYQMSCHHMWVSFSNTQVVQIGSQISEKEMLLKVIDSLGGWEGCQNIDPKISRWVESSCIVDTCVSQLAQLHIQLILYRVIL